MGDDFIKSFSETLPGCYDTYLQWWMLDRIFNPKNEKTDANEFFHWYIIQNYAKEKIESFAKQLPKETMKQAEQELDECKKKVNELSKK